MTDLSADDAARLARIRREYAGCNNHADAPLDEPFLLRLLDAKPAGEPTKPETVQDDAPDRWSRLVARAEAAEAERDRLGTALATAQARVETMRGAIHAMLDEMETDPVGLGMLRATNAARAVMNPATGPGKAPATQKGTGSPASDTGNRGGGASLAAAPSDYEAVCGSTGRPTP